MPDLSSRSYFLAVYLYVPSSKPLLPQNYGDRRHRIIQGAIHWQRAGNSLKGGPVRPECRKCRFYAASGRELEGSGHCRRYPPVIPHSQGADEIDLVLRAGIWPVVEGGSWCGEFQSDLSAREA